MLGKPTPTAEPEAELWFGAHPLAPSKVQVGPELQPLDVVIAHNAEFELGQAVSRRFGRLPFLLKLLAVNEPLSIQAHPSPEQALNGFARERKLGIPPNDPNANYRDDWPKPELICPLTEFRVLCGFRPVTYIVQLFQSLGGASFSWAAAQFAQESEQEALRNVVSSWLASEGDERRKLVSSALDACTRADQPGHPFRDEAQFALELADTHSNDPGVLVALLLHRLVLKPGDGLFVPAGVMHAYLQGMAVEVMASSDNVLRGGLTPKHVDVPELLKLVRFTAEMPQVSSLEPGGFSEQFYDVDAEQFLLSRIVISEGNHWCATYRRGPEMFLCVEGTLDLTGPHVGRTRLNPGECIWIGANDDVYCASGNAKAYRVQVGG